MVQSSGDSDQSSYSIQENLIIRGITINCVTSAIGVTAMLPQCRETSTVDTAYP
jgi:hypothetical protein